MCWVVILNEVLLLARLALAGRNGGEVGWPERRSFSCVTYESNVILEVKEGSWWVGEVFGELEKAFWDWEAVWDGSRGRRRGEGGEEATLGLMSTTTCRGWMLSMLFW